MCLCFIARLAKLLKDEERGQLSNALPKRDFEIAYKLDCRNLCSEFQEDIQFRFSLGITALMHKFLGSQGAKSTLTGGSNYVSIKMYVYRDFSSFPQGLVKGPFLNEKYSKIMQNSQIFILTPLFWFPNDQFVN